MDSRPWKIGNFKITSIVEIEAGGVIQAGIPSATNENISKIPWLAPYFADEQGNLRAVVQMFVIETQDSCIVIDTCVGNSKNRTNLPEWGNLQTDFLSRLENQGYKRETINMVFCTHLHFDHVGWNTMWVSGKWVPTFPQARYLFVEKEFNYWKSHPEKEVQDDHEGFKDSVLQIFESGLANLVSENHAIVEGVSLIPTPGHTPAHVSILIKSGGEQAVITGDALHHPCQIAHPEWETVYDTNKKQAQASRQALLDRFADGKTLIIGSHFALPTAGFLFREGDGFKFVA